MLRRTLFSLIFGTVMFLFTFGHAQAGLKAQCLQNHRDLRLTAVPITASLQTELRLFAAAGVDAMERNYEDDPWGDDDVFDDEFDGPFGGA